MLASFGDHFNFPTPNRADTMYLSSIKPQETGFAQRNFAKETSTSLNIGDIEKARPHYQGYQYTQKETFANRNNDIEGSNPRKLHQPLEKEYFGLRNDDIAGSKPQSHKFVTKREPQNPLNPVYKISQVEYREFTPPKFIRNNIDIKDIDGARPNPHARFDIQRKTNQIDDIDGARPKKEWIPQGKPSSLDVKDINYFLEFHTKRQTDPLSPRYRVMNEDNKFVDYGDLDNKVMVRHPKTVNKVTSSDLKTDDIDGAQASTATQHVNKLSTKHTNLQTQDIPGAQAATLKKGMTTIRQSDPLWPIYQIPGHTDPEPFYGKNTNAFTSTKYANTAGSDFGVTKQAASPTNEMWNVARTPEKVQRQNSGDSVNAAIIASSNERRASGNKTPPPVASDIRPRHEVRTLGSFTKTGEEVLNSSYKTVGGSSEYVPARMPPQIISDSLSKSAKKTGTNFETKKALNSNEAYQKNVKSFFGTSGSDEKKSFKPLNYAERIERYMS